jgi:hypothetical protein
MAKQSYNKKEAFLKEFPIKSKALEVLYSVDGEGNPMTDDNSLKDEIDQILGKEEDSTKGGRNPFLREYLTVLEIERELKKEQAKLEKSKNTQNDFKMKSSEETDTGTKKNLEGKISELNTNIAEMSKKISDLSTRALKSRKSFDEMIRKQREELTSSIQKIKNQVRK